MPKLDEESLISVFAKENYTVLNIYKKNNKYYVDFVCPNNHNASMSYDSFKSKRRCGICYKEKNYTYDKVKEILEKEDYKILDEIFINVRIALKCLCPKGHTCNIYLTHWLKGHRCRECGYLISAEKNRSKNPDRELYALSSKFCHSLRNQIKRLEKNIKIGEKEILFNKLGYTQQDFLDHIKNHPNYFEACKNNNLSIDHIFPMKAFKDFGLLNLEHNWLINCLDNLQPLDRIENSRKNSKYNREEFKYFLRSKGIILE